jgi:hypothetical protein
MNSDQILGIVRHVLTAAGGILVSKGYVDDANLQLTVGALATIIGVVWSVFFSGKKKA